MKRAISTDTLLTLGMALYADKRTMEQRVRGIFGRKRSTGLARAMAAALCLVVGVTCFTTACIPVRADALTQITGAPVETLASIAQERAQTPEAPITPEPDAPKDARLAGFTEAPFAPVSAPARIVREAVDISENRRLIIDADVEIPKVSGYSVTPVERSVLTLSDHEAMLEYLAPGVEWQLYDGYTETTYGSFPEDMSDETTDFFLRAAGEDYAEYTFGGQVGDGIMANRGVYFSKYNGVTRQSDIRPYDEDAETMLSYFDAPWPLTQEEARETADKLLRDFHIEHMALEFADKAIAGSGGQADVHASRGWLFSYVQDNNGLLAQSSYSSRFYPQKGGIAYNLPIVGRLWIYVDETGVAQFDWRGICEQSETAISNVEILPPETICDLLRERLIAIYRDDPNSDSIPLMTFAVRTLRLSADIIGEPMEAGEKIRYDDGAEGLLIPVWEALVDISFASDAGEEYSHTDVYPFSAIDGVGLVCKQFERSVPE